MENSTGLQAADPTLFNYTPGPEEVAERKPEFDRFITDNATKQVIGAFFRDQHRPGMWVEVWTIDSHNCRFGVRENETGIHGWRYGEQIKRPSEA